MSEKNIIITARFHHITEGMRFAELTLKETEGFTQTLCLAQDFAYPLKRRLACCGDMKLTIPEIHKIVNHYIDL